MLVAFWRWWNLLQHLGTKDNERNLCYDLLTIENTDSDLKVHALHSCTMQMSYLYASDFPFKTFCKHAKQTETIRNYQNRVWLWLRIVWETHKLTRYQSKEFSYRAFLYRKSAKAYAYNWRKHSFTARNRSHVFDPEKLTSSIGSTHKTTYKNPGSYCHRCEKSARESRHSHHLIRQRDNIHTRAPDMSVDPRGYMTSEWRNLF